MKRYPAVLILLFGLLWGPSVNAVEIAVIAHKSNKETMTVDDLRNYFTGARRQFQNGETVIAIDHVIQSPARKTFLTRVVEMTEGGWNQHWLQLKSTQGLRRPNQTRSVKFIIKLVSRKAGVISYVNVNDLDKKAKGKVRVVATFKN